MPRTARITLTRVQLESLKLHKELTVNLPPDVDTLLVRVEDGTEGDKALDTLLKMMFGQF